MHQPQITRIVSALWGALMLLAAKPAASSTVVFTCTGAISGYTSGPDRFDSSVSTGTPFWATFGVDTGAADLGSFDPTGWSYLDHNPLNEAYVSFGNYFLAPDPASYAMNSLSGCDGTDGIDILKWGSEHSSGNGLVVPYMTASFQDNSGAALTKKGLPPFGPGLNDLSVWGWARLDFVSNRTATGSQCNWYGDITSISTHIQETPVPEPGSLSLLAAAGLPGLGILLRIRRCMST